MNRYRPSDVLLQNPGFICWQTINDSSTDSAAIFQGLAGSLFFWTFELLVFMVLLNFLLAIIVDAFSVVKDTTSESTGLHEELGQIVREKWRAMLGSILNVHYIPAHRIGALLKQWAGPDSDADALKDGDEANTKKFVKVGCPGSQSP